MAKNRLKEIIKATNWLDRFAYQTMSDFSIKMSKKEYYKVLLYLQIVKLHTSFGAVSLLIKKGYGKDAMVIVRSMLNNLVNITWIISKKQKIRAKKFINYNSVLRHRFLNKVEKYPKDIPHFEKVLTEKQKITSSYNKIKKHFPDKRYWSGMNISQMASGVGLEWDYDFIYNLASSLEHSDINSLNEYIEGIDDKTKMFTFRGGPSNNYTEEAGIAAIKYMGSGIELFIKAFKLKRNYLKRLMRSATRISDVTK